MLLEPSEREWEVAKLVPGGAGFARLSNGQGAFVPGALPGERVLVHEAEDHRTYLQATRWSLLTSSPDRVEPECPVQGRCGGCDLMTLSYAAQLEAKRGILLDALTRVGHFQALPNIELVASPHVLGYRSRIRLHVGEGGVLGFFAAESNELVEIERCLVADPALHDALGRARALFAEHARAAAAFAELELRIAPEGPRVSARLVPIRSGDTRGQPLITALARELSVTVDARVDPERDQRFPLPESVTLRVPAAGFTQVNWDVNLRVVQAVLDGAKRRQVRTFCDLYSGAGNFSLPLLKLGLTGTGIEASEPAIAAAQRAAREQGLGGRFIAGDVRERLAQLSAAASFDLFILDPPRAGAREIVPELLKRAAPHLAYCACDPVTLSRDLRALCDGGYRLVEVTGFDMFPHTHHFETLVWLERAP